MTVLFFCILQCNFSCMMKDDKYWMDKAIDAAEKSAKSGGGPFGCVIVKDGRIVASTSNSVTKDNDPTAHAEINAIRTACRSLGTFVLEGCTLYTSCEPCPMCLAACYWAHIDRIFYSGNRDDAAVAGFDDDHIYEEFRLPMNEREIPIERISAEKGSVPFLAWKNNEDRVEY